MSPEEKAKEDMIREMIREEIEAVLSEDQELVLKRQAAVAKANKEMQVENDPIQKAQANVNLKNAEIQLADAQVAHFTKLARSKRDELAQAKEQESNVRKDEKQKQRGNIVNPMMSV